MAITYYYCRGKKVATVHARASDVRSDVLHEARRQAIIRGAIVVAENEWGDRIAVGDNVTRDACWVA